MWVFFAFNKDSDSPRGVGQEDPHGFLPTQDILFL